MDKVYSLEKEFIRETFINGLLDPGDFETLKRFCQIFSGEVESRIALGHAFWLDDEPDKVKELVRIAKPSMETEAEYTRWKEGSSAV